ncbi:MAG: ORF6N domain-containing protein [Deltaproteobacteria bacterium]|nr:ORF6N domain-containing protein [Deltaproteobacteria bacterium]
MTEIIVAERIEKMIFLMRGHRVMIDADLAELYGVENQEVIHLRSQFVTSNKGRGGRRYLPYAFTEYGVAMLSSVLNSPQAIQVNIQIMRTFGRLRELLATPKDLAQKLEQLERKYDQRFKYVFDAIRQLMEPPTPKPKKPIGFGR